MYIVYIYNTSALACIDPLLPNLKMPDIGYIKLYCVFFMQKWKVEKKIGKNNSKNIKKESEKRRQSTVQKILQK